jgi:hypothetical protein
MRPAPTLVIFSRHWSGSLFRLDVTESGLWFHLFQLPETVGFRALCRMGPAPPADHRLIASMCLVR